jgi:hypothetical protein
MARLDEDPLVTLVGLGIFTWGSKRAIHRLALGDDFVFESRNAVNA